MNIVKPTLEELPLNTRDYMRWSLLAPIVLPIIFYLIHMIVQLSPIYRDIRDSGFYQLGGFVVIASLVGFIPYLFFFWFSSLKLKKLNQLQSIYFILATPFVFFVFQLLFSVLTIIVFQLIEGRSLEFVNLKGAFYISVFVFPVGYGYVAFILVVYVFLRWYWLRKVNS